MKRLLLILLLFVMAGCDSEMFKPYWETEAYKQERLVVKDRQAMLTDGRIYIGMTDGKFTRLWGRDIYPDRSTSIYGVAEIWKFGWGCRSTSWIRAHYVFHFDNGILTYWSEN